MKEVHFNTRQLFKAFCKSQCAFHKYYRWRLYSITKLPKYVIENPILLFDKSKDYTSLKLTSCQIPLISLLYYRTSPSVLLQRSSHNFLFSSKSQLSHSLTQNFDKLVEKKVIKWKKFILGL